MADEKQAGPVLSFNNIALGGKSGGLKGQLKVTSSGFSWKAVTGKSITLTPSDVLRYDWTFVGPLYQLKLGTKGDGSVRFDGFREKDIEGLRTFISAHFGATVNVAEQALLGRNWGDIEFNQNGSSLAFKHQGKQLFEIPLSDVAQATLASKNDVAVEFHLDDTTAALEHDFLSEIRFYIPPDKKADKAEGDGDKNAEPEQSAAEKFQKRILAKADVISYAGSGMVVFKDLTLVFPRGKYEVELYGTFLRLHGKSYDYKVLYSNIPRLFWLSRSDDDRVINVVVSLDQPIKQGQTRYPHLVFQFMKADEEMELPVNLDEENARKYKDKLGKTLKGKPHDIFLQAFKALADKKVSASGAQGGFRSHDKRNAIKCSVKANEGLLYPLERSLFFIPKPPIHVHFDEIAFVEFSRVSSQGSNATTRNFDLIIALKGGSSHQFTNVMRQEFSSLCNYFKAKEVKIKGLNNVSTATAADSDEEGGGREARKAAQAAMREGAESDSDEEDDDFVAKDEDDVPEEYESGPESVGSPSESGSDEESEEKDKKKKEKKEKKDKEKKEKKKDKGEKKKEKKEKKDKGEKKEDKKDKGDKKEEKKDKVEKKEEKKDDGGAGDKRKHSDDEQKEGKKARKADSDED